MVRRISDGREALLARVDNPYVRAMTSRGTVTAYLSGGALGWSGPGIWGRVASIVGPADEAGALLSAVRDAGWVDDVAWYHLPPGTPTPVPVADVFDWKFKWSTAPPAPGDGPDVDLLTENDHPEVNRILDAALPDSAARPGSRNVRAWYGIHRDGRLIACAADQSRTGAEVGFFGGVAVDPAYQGRGLGTALTLALAARLHAEFGPVALAVMGDNPRAIGLYDRLGFAATVPRLTVRPTPEAPA